MTFFEYHRPLIFTLLETVPSSFEIIFVQMTPIDNTALLSYKKNQYNFLTLIQKRNRRK
jgi:hypothetical protein